MTVLLDTNIIMDALQERHPFDAVAKELLLRSEKGEIKCCFTVSAATDIFYIYTKARDLNSARNALNYLFANYSVISVSHEDCTNALSLPIDDFEDALAVTCAKREEMDYIVTRDGKFLHSNPFVPLIPPEKLLEKLDIGKATRT